MNQQHERAQLIKLIQDSLTGIESKTIIERICGVVTKDGELIQVDKDCHVDETGGIREVNIFSVKVYACGCRVDGRSNFGGIDHRGNVACAKHFYRCIRCRRPLSTLTLKTINGFCYCAHCARMVKMLRFLGLKK